MAKKAKLERETILQPSQNWGRKKENRQYSITRWVNSVSLLEKRWQGHSFRTSSQLLQPEKGPVGIETMTFPANFPVKLNFSENNKHSFRTSSQFHSNQKKKVPVGILYNHVSGQLYSTLPPFHLKYYYKYVDLLPKPT